MSETRSNNSEKSFINRHSGNINDGPDAREIQTRLENFEREIIELKFENSLFETVLERKKNEIALTQSFSTLAPGNASQGTTPTASSQDLQVASATGRGERNARKRSKSRSTQSDIRIHLSMEQKLGLATSEYEVVDAEKVRLETAHKKLIDELESDIEWIIVEAAENETAISNFLRTRDFAIDKRTKKVIGEKIERYFHEHLQGCESSINKLRDRSSGLKRQIITFDAQLKHKEEMGDTLHEIDFKQLKIENRQYLDKIDEKNIELVALKQQVAKVTQTLNQYKNDLHESTKQLVDIQRRIEKQDSLHEIIHSDITKVGIERSHASKKQYDLVDQIQNYRAPEIIDYVRRKALLSNLQRDCQVWERKVNLVSMSLRQSRQKWHELNRAARPFDSTDF